MGVSIVLTDIPCRDLYFKILLKHPGWPLEITHLSNVAAKVVWGSVNESPYNLTCSGKVAKEYTQLTIKF
jgi:hypothetical protein